MRRVWWWCFGVIVAALWSAEAVASDDGGSSRTYPGDREAGQELHRRATLAFQERRYAEAGRLFEEAWETYQHPLFMHNVGQCYRRAGRWREAVTAYQRRLELEPAPPNYIHAHIGYCLLQLREREEANRAFRRYLEVEPNGDASVQVRRALETGQWPEGEDRRPAEAVRAARDVHERAERLVEQGQFQQAAQAYMEGYQQNSQVHELLLNAALCSLWAGQTEQAIETFNRYLQTPGADAGAHVHIAESRISQGNFVAAREAYQRYLQADPDGEFAEQARHIVRFIERLNPVPTNANMAETKQHIGRADEHARARRFRRALSEYEAAYRIVPAMNLRFNVGVCHRGLGNHAQALECFEFYLQQMGDEGNYASVHLDAAACLAGLNRVDEARRHIQAYRARADASELPGEAENREWASEIERGLKGD